MSDKGARKVETARELIHEVGVSIEGITFYGVSASLRPDLEGVLPEPDDIVPTYGLKSFIEPETIGIRMTTTVSANVGTIEVDVAITYRTPEPVELDEETVLDFANNVGVMALLPFIREAVADLSTRVFGKAVLMPVMQLGSLEFRASPDSENDESSR